MCQWICHQVREPQKGIFHKSIDYVAHCVLVSPFELVFCSMDTFQPILCCQDIFTWITKPWEKKSSSRIFFIITFNSNAFFFFDLRSLVWIEWVWNIDVCDSNLIWSFSVFILSCNSKFFLRFKFLVANWVQEAFKAENALLCSALLCSARSLSHSYSAWVIY